MSSPATYENRPFLPTGDWRSYRTLLAGNPDYQHFWLAGVISQLGNWFNYIAIFVLLTRLTGSGHAVGWFLISKFLPSSLLGPAAGVVADRLPRKLIMIVSDLLRAGLVLAFLLVRRPDQVWLVYLLAFTQESIWTFFDPARRASVPNLCRPEELNVANALSGASWSVMLAFGAALGGVVTALVGWRTAIVVDAVTFLISAGLVATITLPSPVAHAGRPPGWRSLTGLHDLREGLDYVLHHREVAALLLVKSGWALSGGVLVLLTWFGEQVFAGFGAGSGSGILYSARGLGAAIGPILAWHLLGEGRESMYRAIGWAFLVASGAYLLFSQAGGLLAGAAFVLLGHLGGSVQWVFSTNLLQRLVPDRFRGRVFAAEMALLTLVLSLSTWFTGAALDHGVDPRTVAVRLALLFLFPCLLWTGWLLFGRSPQPTGTP